MNGIWHLLILETLAVLCVHTAVYVVYIHLFWITLNRTFSIPIMATLGYGNQSDTNLIYAIYTYKSNVPNCILNLFLNHKIILHLTV